MTQEIVVIGGGYAGLGAVGVFAKDTTRDPFHVTLVDPSEGHELIPELPEALRRHDPIEEHILSFKKLLKDTGVTHVSRRAIGVSKSSREVTLDDHSTLPFDALILSPGSVTSFPPIPGLQEKALPLRNATDTRHIKDRLHYTERQRVVVVGGGLTGVEVAGMLASQHDVWLVEGASRLLPALGSGLAQYAQNRLIRAGVKVLLGQKLTRVEDQTIVLEHDDIHADIMIWAGGIRPPAWLKNGDLPIDDQGYPKVDLKGAIVPGVFAAGDIWRVKVGHEEVPQTAQVAALAGAYVGDAVIAYLRHKSPPPDFRPALRGMLISLDQGSGVGWVLTGGIPVRGLSARGLKKFSFRQYRLKISRVFGHGWPF